MVTEARPVRTPASSCLRCSSAPFIRLLTSAYRPLRSLTSIGLSPRDCRMAALQNCRTEDREVSCGHQRSDGVAADGSLDVARRPQIEYDDRQTVVHAERYGR